MISVKPLTTTPIETIYQAFINAFSDYTETFNATSKRFKHLLERQGYDPELSFGAFINEKIVGFTLNGVAEWDGKLTAYDIGTGVIIGFRKQGIATQIFDESLSFLGERKIEQYLLEVIKTNTSAFNLYQKAGFKIMREFNYYIAHKDDLKFGVNKLHKSYSIKPIDNPDWNFLSSFWDFYPSWQNSIDSVNRKRDHFTILGIWVNNNLAGYGIVEHQSGDIPQIAVHKSYRRKGLATTLLKNLLVYIKNNDVSIINSAADYEPFNKFIQSINLNPGTGQYEMLLEL